VLHPKLLQQLWQAVVLSSRFSAGIVSGVMLGMGVDRVAGTSPSGVMVGALVGIAAGTWTLIRAIQFNHPHPPSNTDHDRS